MNLLQTLSGLGGAARRRELVAAGFGGSALQVALDRGEIQRPARGVFAIPGAEPDVLAAKCVNAELACISAAQRLGLWILRAPSCLHVSVNHGRPLDARFIVHRSNSPGEVAEICVQAMRCLPELDALCIVESAVARNLVSLAQLRERSSGRRDGDLRSIVAHVDPHSESIIETVGRYHLVKAGFSVQSQVYVKGVGRLDLFVDGILGIEADGREFHSGKVEFEEDRRRGNLLTVGGIPVLRASYPLLVDAPDVFLDLVRRGLALKRAR
ncbi:hypothetical protein [Arthrobacter sp. H5]|uniref:hypothetical protein n=1 Tax=Arthrobacter sp. H5 TaxID=1267973 RepID=UPI00047F7AD5|nr:hypothetical protein [Arthrobacter sp. H5]